MYIYLSIYIYLCTAAEVEAARQFDRLEYQEVSTGNLTKLSPYVAALTLNSSLRPPIPRH